ncbi:ATP-binding protein [Idiomarina loihiensis]|uniref:sensor histidine kinase n=1 Tax=Idiomarina loihiensis TaxID=135577 RepID=UPI00384CEFE8
MLKAISFSLKAMTHIGINSRKEAHYTGLFRYLVCALFLFSMHLPTAEAASGPLTLGRDIPYSWLADPKGQLSLEQATEKLRQQVSEKRGTFSRGYVRDTFWLRFELKGSAFAREIRWLEVGPNFVDDIQLYARPIGSNAHWLQKQSGDLFLGKSDLDYRNPVFSLAPPAGDVGYEVIVRVQSSSATIFHANLWQPTEFMNKATKSTTFWSFYLGLATLSALLAIVLAVVVGGSLLWSAAAFSSSFILIASVQGFINWVFPSFVVPLQHYLTSITTLMAYATILWLCAESFSLRQYLPRVYKILIALSLIILSLLVLIPFDLYGLAIKLQTGFYLLGTSLIIGSICFLWWRSNFRLSILLLGAAPLICILGSLSAVFSTLGLVPFIGEIYVIWQFALITLIPLVISIAVYRMRDQKLKEIEKRQIAAELKAERDANFHQRQFMGMVSHEFRTPLAVISASLENLWNLEKNEENNARVLRYHKIRRATERLVLLSDNCLSDARLAADNLYINPQPTHLIELVQSAADLVQLTDDHQLIITLNGKLTDEPKNQQGWTVNIDAALIRIALSNVIDNAVKHSSGKNIHIDCKIYNGKPAIQVSDEGPGIKTEDTDWIFERYRRGTSNKRGVGLGLYIARQICRAHGGDIDIVSTGPEGNCFELTFKSGDEEFIQ